MLPYSLDYSLLAKLERGTWNNCSHENQPCPPTLSDRGEIRPAKAKSGMIDCLLLQAYKSLCECPPVDVKILDGQATSNMLHPVSDCKMLEKFFVVMYCPTLNTDEINMARRMLFTQGGRSLENIPPTAGALKQHILRSSLQSRMWTMCPEKEREDTDASKWGWKETELGYIPLRSEHEDFSSACRELIKCECKKSCCGRCKCHKTGVTLYRALCVCRRVLIVCLKSNHYKVLIQIV